MIYRNLTGMKSYETWRKEYLFAYDENDFCNEIRMSES